ncbi:MAG: hypothetical protein AAGD34_22840 [Pseudomonadota bacterium]
MIRRLSLRAGAPLAALAGILIGLNAGPVAADDSAPSIEGVWVGTYNVAFPRHHPVYPDQSVETSMELEVYRQEDHLIWVENRWKHGADAEWIVEHGTGAFDLDDDDTLIITEAGPPPTETASNGFFVGEYDDGQLHLTYSGFEDGISFSVTLDRKPQ